MATEAAHLDGEQKFIQTGGHADAFTKLAGGRISKKVSKKEFEFYGQTLAHHPDVKPFLPTFYGVEQKDGNSMCRMCFALLFITLPV
jgi:hypothetical protein